MQGKKPVKLRVRVAGKTHRRQKDVLTRCFTDWLVSDAHALDEYDDVVGEDICGINLILGYIKSYTTI